MQSSRPSTGERARRLIKRVADGARRLAPLVLGLSLLACSSIPRDPEETLKRVRVGELRVGLVEHPP